MTIRRDKIMGEQSSVHLVSSVACRLQWCVLFKYTKSEEERSKQRCGSAGCDFCSLESEETEGRTAEERVLPKQPRSFDY